MEVILARASCRYTGRIDAELTLGDVCIVLRDQQRGGDGSVLVIGPDRGIGARNWMPAGSEIVTCDSKIDVIHERREERLEIFIDTIHSRQIVSNAMPGDLLKLGVEREFSDLIAVHLDDLTPMFERTLDLVSREWRSSAGPIDLLCIDHHTRTPIAIEVKRRRVSMGDIYQVRRYLDALARSDEFDGRKPFGYLVGPVLARPAKELLENTSDISFVRLKFQDLTPAP